jgi:outer membrane protein assembly factor BamB
MCLLVCGAFVALGADSNWPQFRGSQAGVVADNAKLPDAWSTTRNVAWVAAIPGSGWGSPVVWGDHVFVTSVVSPADVPPKAREFTAREISPLPSTVHRWMVYDLNLKDGKIRWQRDVGSAIPSEPKHMKNSYASETPVTDGERVYVYFASIGLFAFDMKGKPVWSNPLPVHKMRNGWGAAASPVVHNGRVYIVNDNEEASFLAAYDAKSGKEIWRVSREPGSSWVTPYIWQHPERTEIVTIGLRKVTSYDLDGRQLWELSGISTLSIPTPFAMGGLLFVSSGFRVEPLRPTYAIRTGAIGDISLAKDQTSNQYIAWMNPTLSSYNPSSIVYGSYYYTLYDTSFLAANDAKTGLEIYGKRRISPDSTGFSASPWAYNGKIFAMSEDGDTFVIQAGPEFKILGKNSLNEMTLATPAIANDSLIIRTASKIYCIRR